MKKIRVTFTGFFAFFIGICSIFTGFIFTTIITRSLTQQDFATYAIIGTILTYALMMNPLISYWNTREFARGEKTGKTAAVSSGFLGVIGLITYLIIVHFFVDNVEINKIIYLGAILIPLESFRVILVGMANGFKPQIEEYGILAFEIVKVIFVVILFLFFELDLFGIILATFFATMSSVIILSINLRSKFIGKFEKEKITKWIKLFWIPLFPRIPLQIANLDVIIFTLILGSVNGIAYWAAALTISKFVGNSKLIAKAVYPKMLQGGTIDIFNKNLIYVLYFAIPIVAITIVFSKEGLYILNPIYQNAYPVVIFLSLTIFLRTITEIYGSVVQGMDKVDLTSDINISKYLRSYLIKIPILKIIQRAAYLLFLFVFLFAYGQNQLSDIEVVVYWSIIAFISQIPLTVYIHYIVKKETNFIFNWISIGKYIFSASVIFGITYFIMEKFLIHTENIIYFIFNLIGFLLIGISGYLVISYIIDNDSKFLIKSIIYKIRNKI